MYIGAGLALAGAALYYRSLPLDGYAGAFLVVMHGFVMLYEEPTLGRPSRASYEVLPAGRAVVADMVSSRHLRPSHKRETTREDLEAHQAREGSS